MRSVSAAAAAAASPAKSAEEWFSFGNSVDIVGASADEAYGIYANLRNHPQWSTMLSKVEVHEDVPSASTWSLQALGLSFSWTAEITSQQPAKLISWESTSGLKNAGAAIFERLPSDGNSSACRVSVEMSIRAPSLLRRLFQSKRLSSLAEKAIGKDLSNFRRVVLSRQAAVAEVMVRPIANSTYKDGLGACQVLVQPDGWIEMELRGFGTSDSTRKLLEECSAAMAKLPEVDRCTCIVDMSKGIGCSPLAVPTILQFLQQKGGDISRTAVLGPRPLMALAQMIARLAKQSGVAFFSDRQEAELWCLAAKESE